MLLGGHFCLWWGAETRSCEPWQLVLTILVSAMLEEGAPKQWCVLGIIVCGFSELPVCARLSCQSHLHCSCLLSSGQSNVQRQLPSSQAACRDLRVGISLTTVEKLSFFCLITLSNHFLLLLEFPHFLSLRHRRMFEVCMVPAWALYVPSGRGLAVQ